MMAEKGKALDVLAVATAPKMKPMMHLEGDDCVDGAEVGKTTTLTVTARCASVSEDNDEGGSRRSQRWEIQGIKQSGGGDGTDEAKAAIARRVQKKGW